jgi:hypothetical protein
MMLSAGLPTTTGWQPVLPRNMQPVRKELLFSVSDHFAAQGAAIDAGEVFFHYRCEQ